MREEVFDPQGEEVACAAAVKEIASKELRIAALETAVIAQSTTLTQLIGQFQAMSRFLLQHESLAQDSKTWPQYQYMTIDGLSRLEPAAQNLILTQIQAMSLLFSKYEIPYPNNLPEACDSLAYAVETCIQDTMALEEAAYVIKSERDRLENQNLQLKLRLRRLQESVEQPEVLNARRISVASARAPPASVITK